MIVRPAVGAAEADGAAVTPVTATARAMPVVKRASLTVRFVMLSPGRCCG